MYFIYLIFFSVVNSSLMSCITKQKKFILHIVCSLPIELLLALITGTIYQEENFMEDGTKWQDGKKMQIQMMMMMSQDWDHLLRAKFDFIIVHLYGLPKRTLFDQPMRLKSFKLSAKFCVQQGKLIQQNSCMNNSMNRTFSEMDSSLLNSPCWIVIQFQKCVLCRNPSIEIMFNFIYKSVRFLRILL